MPQVSFLTKFHSMAEVNFSNKAANGLAKIWRLLVLVRLAAIFSFSPLSLPCVVFQLVFQSSLLCNISHMQQLQCLCDSCHHLCTINEELCQCVQLSADICTPRRLCCMRTCAALQFLCFSVAFAVVAHVMCATPLHVFI